jgi:hypothetical protein
VSRAGLLLVRVILLLAAAGSVVVASGLARRRALQSEQSFACPMHPNVRGASASPCPICGMALQPPGASPPVAQEALARPTSLVLGDPLLGPAWVDGQEVVSLLYDDEVQALRPGEVALFRPAGVRVQLLPGAKGWDRGTSQVRWRLERIPPEGLEGKRAVGWVELAPRNREVTVLPYGAVVNSPSGAHVLVVSGDGKTVSPRPIVTGRIAYDFLTVVSGLAGDETVVGREAALYQAERRLGSAR